MTPDKINQAIAEWMGLKVVSLPFTPNEVKSGHNGDWFTQEAAQKLCGTYPRCACPKVIPNFYADLNACREAEAKLFQDVNVHRNYVFRYLIEVCGNQRTAYSATAPQRCEALLKTIGRWEA